MGPKWPPKSGKPNSVRDSYLSPGFVTPFPFSIPIAHSQSLDFHFPCVFRECLASSGLAVWLFSRVSLNWLRVRGVSGFVAPPSLRLNPTHNSEKTPKHRNAKMPKYRNPEKGARPKLTVNGWGSSCRNCQRNPAYLDDNNLACWLAVSTLRPRAGWQPCQRLGHLSDRLAARNNLKRS